MQVTPTLDIKCGSYYCRYSRNCIICSRDELLEVRMMAQVIAFPLGLQRIVFLCVAFICCHFYRICIDFSVQYYCSVYRELNGFQYQDCEIVFSIFLSLSLLYVCVLCDVSVFDKVKKRAMLEIVIYKFHTAVAEISDVCRISCLVSEQLRWLTSVKFVKQTNNITHILLIFILQKSFAETAVTAA